MGDGALLDPLHPKTVMGQSIRWRRVFDSQDLNRIAVKNLRRHPSGRAQILGAGVPLEVPPIRGKHVLIFPPSLRKKIWEGTGRPKAALGLVGDHNHLLQTYHYIGTRHLLT
jgi:hypothetical protein